MTLTPSDVAIVRHVKTNTMYRYLGNDTYINLGTGGSGVIPPEQAQRIFKINLEMTQLIADNPVLLSMVQENPTIAYLIHKLKLTYEQT